MKLADISTLINNIKTFYKQKNENKFSLMWPRLKLGYNHRLKHKSNWNFRTSY